MYLKKKVLSLFLVVSFLTPLMSGTIELNMSALTEYMEEYLGYEAGSEELPEDLEYNYNADLEELLEELKRIDAVLYELHQYRDNYIRHIDLLTYRQLELQSKLDGLNYQLENQDMSGDGILENKYLTEEYHLAEYVFSETNTVLDTLKIELAYVTAQLEAYIDSLGALDALIADYNAQFAIIAEKIEYLSKVNPFTLTPADHILMEQKPPEEDWVNGFTVGFVNPDGTSYVPPVNTYYDGNPAFYFLTGDPSRASENGNVVNIIGPNGNFHSATLMYLERTTFSQMTAGNVLLEIEDVSVLPQTHFHFSAASVNMRANTTYFFDAGRFIDMTYHDNNSLSGNNTSIVGLYNDNITGEPLTTIFKRPIPLGAAATGGGGDGRMARWRFNTPNNYIRNVILDGSRVDMRTPNGWGSGNDRGAYFVVVGTNTEGFVARDIIIQNIGRQNTSVMNGGIFAGAAGNQRNVAINILRAVTGQRNFEDLRIRNVMTTGGYGIIQFNNTMHNYFINLNLENPNAAGTGTAMHANASPIKIEHNITQAEVDNWLGGDVANQGNFVFDGYLLFPPNRNTASNDLWIQDYRYQNILVPQNFAWALTRTANGNYTNAAIRVYNHKRSPIANHAALQLDTGYWFVEALPAPPGTTTLALQTQLNNINTVRNLIINGNATTSTPVAGPGPWTSVPTPNIKMIANNAGELDGFNIPDFTAPAIIVALFQTATPSDTLRPALAHASSGIGTGSNVEFVPYIGAIGGIVFPVAPLYEHLIFNFNFRTPTPDWTIEDAEGGNIANFTRANSGRNLYVQYLGNGFEDTYGVRIIKAATGTVTNGSALTCTLTITNTGSMPLSDLVVIDNLPPQLTNPRDILLPAGATGGFSGQSLNVILDTLEPGHTVTITFVVTVHGAPGQNIRNIATVSNNDASDSDHADVSIPNISGGGWTRPPATPPAIAQPQLVVEPIPTPMSPYHLAYLIGYEEDGSISPNANITRAEVATIFFRLISDQHRVDVWSQTNPFPDVWLEQWFNNSISTLANDDLLMGYPDGYFRPAQSITRAEFATIVVRIMGHNHAADSTQSTFTDIAGHWAENSINTAYYIGWLQGYGDGTFRPGQPITRAEVAAIVNRALGRLPEHAGDLLLDMIVWPDNMDVNAWFYLYIQEATNSHYYEMKADRIHERWTGLIAPRQWWRLERPESNPNIFIGAYIGRESGMRDED